MEYFEKITSHRISGYNEIKSIDTYNCHDYIKELIETKMLHRDLDKLLLFLSDRIKELEGYVKCPNCDTDKNITLSGYCKQCDWENANDY